MRILALVTIVISIVLTGCRDPEEAAMNQLQEQGYGFLISDFHQAATDGDEVAVAEFLAAGMKADVEAADGTTAFHLAVVNQQDAVATALLEAGADPDQRLNSGRTALTEIATRTGDDLQLLDSLLAKGADPRAKDATGMTAMIAASLGGHVDAVRRLVERDLRSLDKALMLAAASGHTHCMEVVIEHGAYVNCRSHDTRTPLMLAAAKGHHQAALLLLQHNVNRFATDDQGRDAAEWADVSGHQALANTLRDTSTLRWAPGRVTQIEVEGTDSLSQDLVASVNGQVLTLTEIDIREDPDTIAAMPPEPERPILDAPLAVNVQPSPTVGSSASSSASKPMAAVDLKRDLKLGRYEEGFIPILLTSVQADNQSAEIRILTQQLDRQQVTVRTGEMIPSTHFKVAKISVRSRAAKGGGEIDISEIMAENTDNGSHTRFVSGALTRNFTETYLTLHVGKQRQSFVARLGDKFTISETGQIFKVASIRPHQLLIRDLETSEVLTIERQ